MPPEQCPACARFLSRAFVERATDGPQPCPHCGAEVHLGPAAEPDDHAPAADPHPLDDWDRGPRPLPGPGRAVDGRERYVVAGLGALLGWLLARRGRRWLGAVLGTAAALAAHLQLTPRRP